MPVLRRGRWARRAAVSQAARARAVTRCGRVGARSRGTVTRRPGGMLRVTSAWRVPDPILESKPQLLHKRHAAPALASHRGGQELRSDFWIETISDLPGPRIYVVCVCGARRCRRRLAMHDRANAFQAAPVRHGGRAHARTPTYPRARMFPRVCPHMRVRARSFATHAHAHAQNTQLHNLLSLEECEHLKSLGVMTGMEKVCHTCACVCARASVRVYACLCARAYM